MAAHVEVARGPDVEVARALQLRIMRPNGPLPTDREPPDDWLQLVARDDSGDIIGAARFGPSPWPRSDLADPPTPAWQLRSVAVLPEQRGGGFGTALIGGAQAVAVTRGAATLWAEARLAALPLYQRLGWHAVGAEWDKPGVGPHRFVWVALLHDDPTERQLR